MNRPTFTAWFVQALACAGAAFFAWTQGVFQTIYANDMSMMTSVIAALFVCTAAWAGRQAWTCDLQETDYLRRADRASNLHKPDPQWPIIVDSSFGHDAERWAVMLGFVGTAIGLSMQAKSLAGGATSFTALATSLFTTASGGTAAILISVMTRNLEQGIKRSLR